MSAPFQTLTDKVLGLLFPDRCAGCGRTGSLLCERCCASLRPYPAQRYALSSRKAGQSSLLDQIAIGFVFEGALREAVHTLKYNRVRRMAGPLSELLAQHLRDHPLPADALVPVPLHARRLSERGFNQSELLAQHLAARTGVPCMHNGLLRSRDTPHQVGLDAQQRRENVRAAFVWQSSTPPPQRVLLIDDVLTTGATLEACAETLRRAGAREVGALALARSSIGDDAVGRSASKP